MVTTKQKGYKMIRQRKLKRFLKYNSKTGEFIGGNNISLYSRGYLRMRIEGKSYGLQQLAWIYMYGKIPTDKTIGFKDKDKQNLKIDNLYIRGNVSIFNKPPKKSNTSGIQFIDGKYVK